MQSRLTIYVHDHSCGETYPVATLAEAMNDAEKHLAEYRKDADEGWGLDEGDLSIYLSDDPDDVTEGTCLAFNKEVNRQWTDEYGNPLSGGFDYICDMILELTDAGRAALAMEGK